jgi:seryl-tRNA synthetase
MKLLFASLLLGAGVLVAQTPAPKPTPTKEITVQSSTSQDALLVIYKTLDENRTKINTALQQARAELDKENKPIQDKIDPLQKQIEANNRTIGQKFQDTTAPFRQNYQTAAAQIEAVSKLVKAENKLPDNATFDTNTGKWTVPDQPAPAAPTATAGATQKK